MKTFPIYRDNGQLHAFEISNFLLTRKQIEEILSSVPDVAGIRNAYGSDDRVMFQYKRESCVVNEPFGDNSRYWIGSAFPAQSSLDVEPVRAAFEEAPNPLLWAWRKVTRTG